MFIDIAGDYYLVLTPFPPPFPLQEPWDMYNLLLEYNPFRDIYIN